MIVWCIAATLALVPVLALDENFYSKSGVCLALPLVKVESTETLYSVSVFIFFNFFVFMAIAVGQLIIYLEIRNVASGSILKLGSKQKKEAVVARSLFMVVLTDFFCWFPVGIMGIMAMLGHEISANVYVWMTVFVIPINSALNPFLYTFASLLKRKRMESSNTDTPASARFASESSQKNRFIDIHESKSIRFGTRTDDYTLSEYLTQDSLPLRISDMYLIATNIAGALQLLHEVLITHGAVSSQTVLVHLQKKGTIKDVQLHIKRSEQKENDNFEPYKDIGDFGLLLRLILGRREELKKFQ